MGKLYDDIEGMKKIIDAYVPLLIVNDKVAVGKNLAILTKGLSEVLPEIIALYDDERMAEYKEDQAYWPMQLQRILGALEAEDFFLSYDALVHEFEANLCEVQRIISEKGIES